MFPEGTLMMDSNDPGKVREEGGRRTQGMWEKARMKGCESLGLG